MGPAKSAASLRWHRRVKEDNWTVIDRRDILHAEAISFVGMRLASVYAIMRKTYVWANDQFAIYNRLGRGGRVWRSGTAPCSSTWEKWLSVTTLCYQQYRGNNKILIQSSHNGVANQNGWRKKTVVEFSHCIVRANCRSLTHDIRSVIAKWYSWWRHQELREYWTIFLSWPVFWNSSDCPSSESKLKDTFT